MEAFLRVLLPNVIPAGRTFEVHAFQGKSDLLLNLKPRLRGYARWLPHEWRLCIVVDRDNDDCLALKRQLEEAAEAAGLVTRSRGGSRWQLVNRIAVEELEAWYFGDWEAVRAEFPRVSPGVPQRQGFRNPDAIQGGTWEAFERVMRNHGYFKGGLPKIEAARRIAARMVPARNRSASFQALNAALVEGMKDVT